MLVVFQRANNIDKTPIPSEALALYREMHDFWRKHLDYVQSQSDVSLGKINLVEGYYQHFQELTKGILEDPSAVEKLGELNILSAEMKNNALHLTSGSLKDMGQNLIYILRPTDERHIVVMDAAITAPQYNLA